MLFCFCLWHFFWLLPNTSRKTKARYKIKYSKTSDFDLTYLIMLTSFNVALKPLNILVKRIKSNLLSEKFSVQVWKEGNKMALHFGLEILFPYIYLKLVVFVMPSKIKTLLVICSKIKCQCWLANLFGTREAEEAEMKEKTSNSPTTSKGCKEHPSKTTHAHNNYQETRLEESSEASSIPYGNHLG